MKVSILAILLVLVSTFLAAFGSLYLKKGSGAFKMSIKKILSSQLLVGIFLYASSTIFFIWALRMAQVSILYPITSLTYIWVSLLSVRVLKEKMNSYKWAGIVLIMIGVILITL